MGDNDLNNYETNDEDYLKAFIGKNYEKLTTKQFNLGGFLFRSMVHILQKNVFIWLNIHYRSGLNILAIIFNYTSWMD